MDIRKNVFFLHEKRQNLPCKDFPKKRALKGWFSGSFFNLKDKYKLGWLTFLLYVVLVKNTTFPIVQKSNEALKFEGRFYMYQMGIITVHTNISQILYFSVRRSIVLFASDFWQVSARNSTKFLLISKSSRFCQNYANNMYVEGLFNFQLHEAEEQLW